MPRVRKDSLEFSRLRLLVSDFDTSWRFYRDHLGLTPMAGHGHPPYGEFSWKGQPLLALFERKRMAAAVGLTARSGGRNSVGRSALILEVKNVDAFGRRLRSRGIRLLRAPTDRPEWGLRTIHLRDPDGYLIEIYSDLPRR